MNSVGPTGPAATAGPATTAAPARPGPRAILHRGAWHNNRAFGVLHAFLHPPYWSETDVLWNGREWVLAHDSWVYGRAYGGTDTLAELVGYVQRLRLSEPSECHRYLLIDVKWEEVYHSTHARAAAPSRLADVTSGIRAGCLWYQFSDLGMYRLATRHPVLQTARLGLLVESALLHAGAEVLSADFIMLPLDRFSPTAVRALRHGTGRKGGRDDGGQGVVLGYTCPSLREWHAYSFLYDGCLDGLVVAAR